MGTRPSQDTLHFKSFSMSSLGSISTFSSISTWLVALLAQKLCPVPKSPDYKNSKSLPKPSKNITRAQPSTPQTTNLITQKDNHKSKKKTAKPPPVGHRATFSFGTGRPHRAPRCLRQPGLHPPSRLPAQRPFRGHALRAARPRAARCAEAGAAGAAQGLGEVPRVAAVLHDLVVEGAVRRKPGTLNWKKRWWRVDQMWMPLKGVEIRWANYYLPPSFELWQRISP